MKGEKEWLESLKTGDEVVVHAGGWGRSMHRGVVSRTTATQVIVITVNGHESRYSKRNAYRVGAESYNRSFIGAMTDDIRERIELSNLHAWLKDIATSAHKLPMLRALHATYTAELARIAEVKP